MVYTLKLYVTSDLKSIQTSDVQLGSAAPVRIIMSPRETECSGKVLWLITAVAVGLLATLSTALAQVIFHFIAH